MTDEILLIPEVPQGLREAAQRGILVPFVGAGLSRLAGCPGWEDFANNALRQLVDQSALSHAQMAQLRGLSPRVKLSLAQITAQEKKIILDYRQILYPHSSSSTIGEAAYGHISRLSKRFITTNYDEWLDRDYSVAPAPTVAQGATSTALNPERSVFYRVPEFTAANLAKSNSVIHIHGCLRDPASMIVTTRQYLAHYANDRKTAAENYTLTFLDWLFDKKVVLFVGYGLEELEILEYVLLKARQARPHGGPQQRHFLLQGFFSHERDLMRSLQRYYLEECSIGLIPFLRDNLDHNQVVEVLKEYGQILPASDPGFLEDFKQMSELVK